MYHVLCTMSYVLDIRYYILYTVQPVPVSSVYISPATATARTPSCCSSTDTCLLVLTPTPTLCSRSSS